MTHSISGAFGWKLIEEIGPRIAALAAVAPASPGNMGRTLGTLVRDEGAVKVVAMPSGETRIDLRQMVSLEPGFAFAKLVGSSRRFPAQAFDAYFGSLLGISGRVMFERTNIGGVQLKVEDVAGFAGKPILVVTGTDDVDHPRALDAEIVSWLNEAGAKAQLLYLGDQDMEGNGHMMMLEENSAEIARAIMRWLDAEAGPRG
jgi:pimeloyl-ACP methyl ester carboxylesterase